MGSAYTSGAYKEKVAQGLRAALAAEGPIYVHCMEGKDRTGFVCMLIEALAGAGYQQIADDYMETYDNYYKITQAKDPARYQTILEKNLEAMLQFVINDPQVDFKNADLTVYARRYLNHGGMSDQQIDELLLRICE
jgi:protein tyrosine/serine phosphatase